MIITLLNYKSIIPEKLHDQFLSMAGREGPIIYKGSILRYDNIDEY